MTNARNFRLNHKNFEIFGGSAPAKTCLSPVHALLTYQWKIFDQGMNLFLSSVAVIYEYLEMAYFKFLNLEKGWDIIEIFF